MVAKRWLTCIEALLVSQSKLTVYVKHSPSNKIKSIKSAKTACTEHASTKKGIRHVIGDYERTSLSTNIAQD